MSGERVVIWRMPGVATVKAPAALGLLDRDDEALRRCLRQGRDIDEVIGAHVDRGDLVRAQVAVGAALGVDGGVAVVRGDHHRRARRLIRRHQQLVEAQALDVELAADALGVDVVAELGEDIDLGAQPLQRHAHVHRPAAHVDGDAFRLHLAPGLDHEEGLGGVEEADALDVAVGDDGDDVHHGRADGEGLERGHGRTVPRGKGAIKVQSAGFGLTRSQSFSAINWISEALERGKR